jgi:hypothetical protein
MIIKSIIIFLIGAYVGGELAYYFVYSPKAQVKILWKQIYKLNQFIIDTGDDSVRDYLVNDSTRKAIADQKKKINILLDYYFNEEEDQEFAKNNRPSIE